MTCELGIVRSLICRWLWHEIRCPCSWRTCRTCSWSCFHLHLLTIGAKTRKGRIDRQWWAPSTCQGQLWVLTTYTPDILINSSLKHHMHPEEFTHDECTAGENSINWIHPCNQHPDRETEPHQLPRYSLRVPGLVLPPPRLTTILTSTTICTFLLIYPHRIL